MDNPIEPLEDDLQIAKTLRLKSHDLISEIQQAQEFLDILATLQHESLIDLPDHAVTLLRAYEECDVPEKMSAIGQCVDNLTTICARIKKTVFIPGQPNQLTADPTD